MKAESNSTEYASSIQVPVLVAERIIDLVQPEDCPHCREDFTPAGKKGQVRVHKSLCPIRQLFIILEASPR